MPAPLLEIKNLSHIHEGGESGICNISFNIYSGEYIILAGKNGSGKTTLLRHLNGLIRPDMGKVLFEGKDIAKQLTYVRQQIGMVFQEPDVQIIGDTVFDEVAFGPENLKMPREKIIQRVNNVLDNMQLRQYKNHNPSLLSGGEKQRLAIAGILVMDPKVILFDEPFANLDYPSRKYTARLIRNLNKQDRTIIMATHDVETVIKDISRILILENGNLIQDGSPQQIVDKFEQYGIQPLKNSKTFRML